MWDVSAAVFENNGNDERGDLGAVVKAILLDEEARTEPSQQANHFGKVKEPLIRGMQYMRAFGGVYARHHAATMDGLST